MKVSQLSVAKRPVVSGTLTDNQRWIQKPEIEPLMLIPVVVRNSYFLRGGYSRNAARSGYRGKLGVRKQRAVDGRRTKREGREGGERT